MLPNVMRARPTIVAVNGFSSYLSSLDATAEIAKHQFEELYSGLNLQLDFSSLAIITHEDLQSLTSRVYRREHGLPAVMSTQAVSSGSR